VSSDVAAKLKALERENRELRQANEILRKRQRILPRRSSTAGSSHDRVHRRSPRGVWGRADLQGPADPLGWLTTCVAGGTFATLALSTYHADAAKQADPAKLSARGKRDVLLKVEVQRVFAANFQVYGVRKVWRQLRREGFDVARRTVERLMQRMSLTWSSAANRSRRQSAQGGDAIRRGWAFAKLGLDAKMPVILTGGHCDV
jgi:hypothetical protein